MHLLAVLLDTWRILTSQLAQDQMKLLRSSDAQAEC